MSVPWCPAPFRLPQRRRRVILRVACRCAPGEADGQSPRRGVLRTVDWFALSSSC
ncbi:hypothetical protein ACFPRL_06460 [Pseudoclavibacter helvolus]